MKIDENISKIKDSKEAAVGFEPTHKGFADLRLRPLGHAAIKKPETQFL